LNSTNAGYGIVLALVICACIAFGILFFLTMRRINATRQKTTSYQKEIKEVEQKIAKA
jgi:preprotein translocase subunit YajC